MPETLHIGCCGWSYLNEHEFAHALTKPHRSKLQAYAQLFTAVEINTTFYRLPRLGTATTWRKEADEVAPQFAFTVKAYQGITHLHRFKGKEVLAQFESLVAICHELRTRVLLFQSPASFKPTKINIDAMQNFFRKVERATLVYVWEPRGSWYDEPGLIAEMCESCHLIHCVDPLRNDTALTQRVAYFRLHGFGKPSKYSYDFSHEELQRLRAIMKALPRKTREAYVFFNNVACYKNGREFAEMME